MNILADLHHEALFYSLQLLFEKRLGWKLYRPIGLDWYEKGYWAVYPHPDTAKQFLQLGTFEPVQMNPVKWINLDYQKEQEEGFYTIINSAKGTAQRAITLDKFKQTQFDILISSIPAHISPFDELIKLYQPKAKHIFQIGNAWRQIKGVKNIMASTAPFETYPQTNICFYHQEFDLDVFKYELPKNRRDINSYIHYMQRKDLMNEYATYLSEYNLKSYGAGMESDIDTTNKVAKSMTNSAFTWHYKPEGDGFGHVLYSTYACGRPAIIWKPFYNGKSADSLLEDNITCIDISHGSIQENVKRIRSWSTPENHLKICESAYQRFNNIVNFDYEFEYILKPFINKVLND